MLSFECLLHPAIEKLGHSEPEGLCPICFILTRQTYRTPNTVKECDSKQFYTDI